MKILKHPIPITRDLYKVNPSIKPPEIKRKVEILSVTVSLLSSRDKSHKKTERFIVEQYARHFSARLEHFPPFSMQIESKKGKILGALGIRPASSNTPLFLEQYLNKAVNLELQEITAQPVCRKRIAEIGNLAASSPACLNWLYFALTYLLDGWGFEWAVFTGTQTIREAFSSLSVDLVEISKANSERLCGSAEQWGTYYEHDPRVVAANVEQTKKVLESHTQLHHYLNPLLSQAKLLGSEMGPLCLARKCVSS